MEMKPKKRKPTIVTSENREAFMAKKLKLAKEEKPVMKEEKEEEKGKKTEKPHGIWKSKSDELHSHYPSEEKAYEAYQKLGQKMADHAMGELSQSECKKCGYK